MKMALTDEGSSGFYMPVAPAYNGGMGNGFGGDGWWILLLLLAFGGGWGNGFGGGFGNMALGYDFPWLMNGQQGINSNVNSGFRDAQLNDSITSVRDGIGNLATQLCGCCGDISTQLCNGFSGVNAGIANAASQAEIAANARQMANMQQLFGVQSALQQCCCDNKAGLADVKYTIATENCADRAAISNGIRDILAANNASTQRILDQLCQDKIDEKNDTINQLRQELLYARGQASQDVQTAAIRAGQAATANQLVSELRSCPIPAQPVYGTQPIFTCGGGCGCNG